MGAAGEEHAVGGVLLDGRNLLDRARLSKAGFRYLSLAG